MKQKQPFQSRSQGHVTCSRIPLHGPPFCPLTWALYARPPVGTADHLHVIHANSGAHPTPRVNHVSPARLRRHLTRRDHTSFSHWPSQMDASTQPVLGMMRIESLGCSHPVVPQLLSGGARPHHRVIVMTRSPDGPNPNTAEVSQTELTQSSLGGAELN